MLGHSPIVPETNGLCLSVRFPLSYIKNILESLKNKYHVGTLKLNDNLQQGKAQDDMHNVRPGTLLSVCLCMVQFYHSGSRSVLDSVLEGPFDSLFVGGRVLSDVPPLGCDLRSVNNKSFMSETFRESIVTALFSLIRRCNPNGPFSRRRLPCPKSDMCVSSRLCVWCKLLLSWDAFFLSSGMGDGKALSS